MSPKSTLSAFLLSSAMLTGCSSEPESKAIVAKGVDVDSGKALLNRMETYATVGQSAELFSVPVPGDGQFMTLSIDSAGHNRVVYTEVASGYSYLMERLKKDKKWFLDVDNIKVVKDVLKDEDPDPSSFYVRMSYQANGASNAHGNDTQSNMEELAILDEVGSPFTLSAGNYESGVTKEQIPAAVVIITDEAKMTVPTASGLRAILFQEKAHNIGVKDIKRQTIDIPNGTDPMVYMVSMDKSGAKVADLLHLARSNKPGVIETSTKGQVSSQLDTIKP